MRLKSKTQKGSVLLTVVVVSMMMMVIVAAGISMVGHTQTRTNREYREKQAYFLASSSLKGFVAEATKFGEGCTPEQAKANIEMLQNLRGEETEVQIQYEDGGTVKNLHDVYSRLNYGADNCKCTIKIVEDGGPNNLKAVATATYLDATATCAATFSTATPSAHASLNNALEFIGSSGGANNAYNNLSVYGNTGSISMDSHDKNILYRFSDNNTEMKGTTDILGSLVLSVGWDLKNNFAYKTGDPVSEAGCVLNVSRSCIFLKDVAKVQPTVTKAADYNAEATYNYVNVGECLMVLGNYSANNGAFAGRPDYQVDVYTSGMFAGKVDTSSTLWTAYQNSFGTDTNSLKNPMDLNGVSNGGGEQNVTAISGNDFYMYGNLYSYDVGNGFNGDLFFNGTHTYVFGEIYCSGDIHCTSQMHPTTVSYVDGDGNTVTVTPKIHMLAGKKVYGGGGSVLADSNGDNVNGIPVTYDNWIANATDGTRAKRPNVRTESTREYLHEPESFFIANLGSSINSSYKSLYQSSTYDPSTGNHLKLKTDLNCYIQTCTGDSDHSSDGVRNGRGGVWHTFWDGTYNGDGSQHLVRPMFYVTTPECIMGSFDWCSDMQQYKYHGGKTMNELNNDADPNNDLANLIVFDVEECGNVYNSDMLILLKHNGVFNFQANAMGTADSGMQIVINNPPDGSGKFSHFAYFCSDSGAGTVTPLNPANNQPTTVDHSTFRNDFFYHFDTKGNNNLIVTEKLYRAFKSHSTGSYVPNDSCVYMFIGAGGHIKFYQNNAVFEGSIYAPKADVEIHKGIQNIQIDYYDSSAPKQYSVLGAVMCKNFINDGNMSVIAYEQAAPNSLLPKIVKSEDLYDAGFKLNRYLPE